MYIYLYIQKEETLERVKGLISWKIWKMIDTSFFRTTSLLCYELLPFHGEKLKTPFREKLDGRNYMISQRNKKLGAGQNLKTGGVKQYNGVIIK